MAINFQVQFNCDNAAFDAGDEETLLALGDCRNSEVARVLRALADRVEQGDLDLPYGMKTYNRTLFDANGNDIGRASYVRGGRN